MAVEVLRSSLEKAGVVLKATQSIVAIPTEQPAYAPAIVAMVYGKPLERSVRGVDFRKTANCAHTILLGEQALVKLLRDAVAMPKLANPLVAWLLLLTPLRTICAVILAPFGLRFRSAALVFLPLLISEPLAKCFARCRGVCQIFQSVVIGTIVAWRQSARRLSPVVVYPYDACDWVSPAYADAHVSPGCFMLSTNGVRTSRYLADLDPTSSRFCAPSQSMRMFRIVGKHLADALYCKAHCGIVPIAAWNSNSGGGK